MLKLIEAINYADRAAEDQFKSPTPEAKLEWLRLADKLRAELAIMKRAAK